MTAKEIAEKLRPLAEKATKGPYELYLHGVIRAGELHEYTNGASRKQLLSVCILTDSEQREHDAAHFAASDPQYIITLIEANEELAAALKRLSELYDTWDTGLRLGTNRSSVHRDNFECNLDAANEVLTKHGYTQDSSR